VPAGRPLLPACRIFDKPANLHPHKDIDMKNLSTLLATASIITTLGMVAPAFSETVKKVMLTEVDPATLTTAWRASDIIGAKVYDDFGAEIGKVEDLLVGVNGTVPFAIVSTIAGNDEESRKVVVAASDFELVGNLLTMHGGSPEALMALPIF
jgi:sporulation protein YlmC with PRC-barrel domain